MIAKLPFRDNVSINNRSLYSSARDVLDIVRGDEYSGWVNIYSTPVKNSMKVEIHRRGTVAVMYFITTLTGTPRTFLICTDQVIKHKLPDIFYVKISKK